MAEKNIMLFENDDKSYTVADLYINSNRYLEYIDSYNYYDFDIDKLLYDDTHKIILKNVFLLYIKMAEKNIMFFENDDKSYTVADLYINSNRYLEYIDSYNYFDID